MQTRLIRRFYTRIDRCLRRQRLRPGEARQLALTGVSPHAAPFRAGYPIDFFAMTDAWIDKLSKRGEQLTQAVIAEHSPHLVEKLD